MGKEAVCVTGVNGFIGSWQVWTLLESGYTSIHGSIFPGSNPTQLLRLNNLDNSNSIRVFEADALDFDAVCKAVEGCSDVFHLASPCSLEDPKDPENDLLQLAVQGTLNVLEATKSFNVRRVVLTSFISTLVPNPAWPPNKEFNESSWTHLDYYKAR